MGGASKRVAAELELDLGEQVKGGPRMKLAEVAAAPESERDGWV